MNRDNHIVHFILWIFHFWTFLNFTYSLCSIKSRKNVAQKQGLDLMNCFSRFRWQFKYYHSKSGTAGLCVIKLFCSVFIFTDAGNEYYRYTLWVWLDVGRLLTERYLFVKNVKKHINTNRSSCLRAAHLCAMSPPSKGLGQIKVKPATIIWQMCCW